MHEVLAQSLRQEEIGLGYSLRERIDLCKQEIDEAQGPRHRANLINKWTGIADGMVSGARMNHCPDHRRMMENAAGEIKAVVKPKPVKSVNPISEMRIILNSF